MKKLHALVAVVGLASISVAAYVYQRQDGSRGKDAASAPQAAERVASAGSAAQR